MLHISDSQYEMRLPPISNTIPEEGALFPEEDEILPCLQQHISVLCCMCSAEGVWDLGQQQTDLIMKDGSVIGITFVAVVKQTVRH